MVDVEERAKDIEILIGLRLMIEVSVIDTLDLIHLQLPKQDVVVVWIPIKIITPYDVGVFEL